MWESSFEGALRGGGVTDDRKKRTNLENAIYTPNCPEKNPASSTGSHSV